MTKELTKKYYEAVGRRKTSVARVRITESKSNSFIINLEKELDEYFPVKELQKIASEALSKIETKFSVSVILKGGGVKSQSGAMRHGIARALVVFNSELKSDLKKAGFLKRDPRMKERKKPGLKKARKAPQWSKR